MRRVDRVRLEKRRRLVLIVGLAFTIGALTAGALIWRGDQLALDIARPAAIEGIAADSPPERSAVEAVQSAAPAATFGSIPERSTPASSIPESSTESSTPESSTAQSGVVQALRNRNLEMPVDGVSRALLHDSFDERRGGGLRSHEAIDIMAPRGTPVRAVEAGRIAKLFRSIPGGLTVYLFDPAEMFSYYYGHLDRYAAGLHDGQQVRRGEVIGYVGSTGNAAEDAPHLHFAISQLGADRKWWQGTAINPYLVLR